ncbi:MULTISPECIES: hypothetical protein [Methylorubrum]|jgi:hypothetical protein|uniref:Uncharacterized protein n=1 Tax=Methylorubrum suomiense TaxID=144191 RepID=A0ABQ4UXL2_9HYPH|nr:MULTISPECIES: hypothetical protein [Methylobacteriaceae]GJE76863.1 hypothetical protein BGCPKDLD_3462 [Methylorubrum suomiense]
MSSGIAHSPARLSEVSRLATLLADQALDAQIERRPIPDLQLRALVDAAELLDAYGQALPPLLGQVMHEINIGSDRADPRRTGRDDEIGRLAWMLRPFRHRAQERN